MSTLRFFLSGLFMYNSSGDFGNLLPGRTPPPKNPNGIWGGKKWPPGHFFGLPDQINGFGGIWVIPIDHFWRPNGDPKKILQMGTVFCHKVILGPHRGPFLWSFLTQKSESGG